MKAILLITALLICTWPMDVFADTQASKAPVDPSRQKTAASRPADAPGAKAKAFTHPETGEILTHEQWQALGLENDEAEAVPHPSSDDSGSENTPIVLEGRQIDLGNGDYVIVIDTPDSEMVKTKVWFDEKGKAHIRCNH